MGYLYLFCLTLFFHIISVNLSSAQHGVESAIYGAQENQLLSANPEATLLLVDPDDIKTLDQDPEVILSATQKFSESEDLSLQSYPESLLASKDKNSHASRSEHEGIMPAHPIRQTILGWVIGSTGLCGGVKMGASLAESLSFNNRDFFLSVGIGSLTGFALGMVVTHYLGVWMNQDL